MDTAALKSRFLELFPTADPHRLIAVRAPGRVNLIGEHVDYNDGFVCPMAIDRSALIIAAPRPDRTINLHSVFAQETATFSIETEIPKPGPAWALYPKGVAEAIRQRLKLDHGFDAIVDSDIPLGGGLSSSAAFEVATGLTLLTINNLEMPRPELALAAQWGEHHYPGMPCGIMDQFISAMATENHALLLDCRNRQTRQVPLTDPTVRVVISNSNVKHALVGGEYQQRREQCEAAVAELQKAGEPIKSLRDVPLEMLEAHRAQLDPLIFRRAWHVVTEIQRTIAFADALEAKRYPACGELMYASHASLRDGFEVSCPEVDALVEIARSVPGVIGARMTGGGFGGCIVALVKENALQPLAAIIDRDYPAKANGKKATTFSTHPAPGATVERL